MAHRALASRIVAAPSEVVLDVALTVDDMVRWFPLPIEAVDPPEDGRLHVGESCLAESVLAGRRLHTRIEVIEAGETRYELAALGPLRFIVTADLVSRIDGCEIHACVEALSGGGLTGRVLEAACRPLLGTGLRQALERLARIAEARPPVPVVAGERA